MIRGGFVQHGVGDRADLRFVNHLEKVGQKRKKAAPKEPSNWNIISSKVAVFPNSFEFGFCEYELILMDCNRPSR